jgi:hypothetical protein
MTSVREAGAIAKKQLAIRELHWPNVEPHLWNRKAHKGFTTIPKTMPLILKAMDEITKGAPVSSTYLTLWCCTWDNSFVVLNKAQDMADAAGFGGQRGVHTWATRMKKLQELHFIDIKPGKSGPMSNAIIWNPHLTLRYLHEKKTPGLTEATYNALIEWALEVGAKDMTDPFPVLASAPASAPAAAPAVEVSVAGIFPTPLMPILGAQLSVPPAPAEMPHPSNAVQENNQ